MKPLKDFEGSKQEPTTSVQMKVELRKMGKTNLFMIIVIMMMMITFMFMMTTIPFYDHRHNFDDDQKYIDQAKQKELFDDDDYDENNDDFDENNDDFDCERDLARSGQWCSVNFSQLG